MYERATDPIVKYRRAARCVRLTVALILACIPVYWLVVAAAQQEAVRLTANFSGQQAVAPNARLELHTSRPLLSNEGRLALLIGNLDVTALCVNEDSLMTYTPKAIPLPLGETSVIVYLVSINNQWTEIARLPLLVEVPKPAAASAKTNDNGGASTVIAPPTVTVPQKREGPAPFQFIPSVSVNIKSQSVALFFPESSRPDRINFTDIAVQASLQGNYTTGAWNVQNHFDLVGSSVQKEALRFGELGNRAMQIDLSSYLMQYQFHRATFSLGHVSFGTNRHLINSFSSRGLSLTVPITKRFDVSAAAMNGTSIVGFNNFFGPTRSKHQIISGSIGVELLPKRPGGLRVELGMLHGSLLPLSSFNQGNVSDAERSRGGSIRVIASDKDQPRYLEVSYDLLRGVKLTESKPLNLNVAYRHERVDPLYRSVATFAQADRLNNQWDVTASISDITFAFDYTRANDNLGGIRSILKTLTRREAVVVAVPTTSLVGDRKKPSVWLPRLSYNFDRVHQLAAFVPINGDFVSPSQIPDQVSTNQGFAAEWQFTSIIRVGYRFNYSFQDNRQAGRERGDFLNEVNGISVGVNPVKTLDLNLDINAERTSNFEQNSINTNLRFGPSVTWRMTNSMVWALSTSTTGAGDRANTNHRRDVDFDILYSWRFLNTEKERWKKVQGQFFIRYANRYASSSDRLFGFNTFTKLQTFNAGLNFVFF